MKTQTNYLYKFLKAVCSALLKILYMPKVYGKENIPKEGSVIFAGNHKHAFDPVVVMTNTNRIVHYMAKEEIFKGLHGIILKKIGIIKVRRGKSNPLAIIEAQEILNNGGTIGIFPEGTRNRTEKELLRFKHGAVVIAKNTNAKIVPFGIKGEYKLFRRSLIIEFGEPIDINKMEIEEANKYLEEKVLELLRK